MELNDYVGKHVMITTKKDSKYEGVISKVTSDKFHMHDLIIFHKDGTFKATSGNKFSNKRWFNRECLKKVDEIS